ncbi:Aerobic glycerol-3-phosphate dehydrogenase [Polystyrenella longa]|uniref:Aerobic glycerol-3-phosphate dehydrogenase n=1 Tax=Polystyrenella longa TaxID=2528007 RepID=A0A518CQ82_9PLAN|nr:glycerol-3-phosphate dehydrogenase/oxidase [Polystyrenella longa]QDU81397.1 Aerobic glycerol-3-phosphate dehydrogenase [Polystyrenella longa]
MNESAPILILGAGINGTAVARELALNNIPSCIVDEHDIAFGATSKSSRLIHGGLRYLEYADFKLVRESLQERNRLAKNAPQFIRPLRLHIPVASRFDGFMNAFSRFVNLSRVPGFKPLTRWMESNPDRGLYVIRTGLKLYDTFAANDQFPAHEVHRVGSAEAPPVDPQQYKWVCSYYDGQMWAVERFVLAMLEDTRQILAKQNHPFHVYSHHRVELKEGEARVLDHHGNCVHHWRPPMIINATGAWGDATLKSLNIPSDQLFLGTKGSHFFTRNRHLKSAIGKDALYAEASDGRPVFVLPVGDSIMVGTTDLPIEGSPEKALATAKELDYLLELTKELFPHIELTPAEIDFFYCGVRPLPYVPANSPSEISRGHAIHHQQVSLAGQGDVTLLTLIGGKLTTCRALAEDVANTVGQELNIQITQNSRDRLYPGAEEYPYSPSSLQELQERWATDFGLEIEEIKMLWELFGTRVRKVLETCLAEGETLTERIPDTLFPKAVVKWILQHEWVPHLEGLVNRRLMMLYDSPLKRESLVALANVMVEAKLLPSEKVDGEVESLVQTLSQMYGKQVF